MNTLKARLHIAPFVVGIAANNVYIHSYASGVIDADDCWDPSVDLNPINHAVLVVGYGTDEASGLEYWLVKNSWNITWGDKGYFKLALSLEAYGICGA